MVDIGLDNYLSHTRRHAVTRTNAEVLPVTSIGNKILRSFHLDTKIVIEQNAFKSIAYKISDILFTS